MRSNLVLNKVLLAVLLLLIGAFAFLFLGLSFSMIGAGSLADFFGAFQNGVFARILGAALGIVLLAGAVWAALVFLFSNGEEGIGRTGRASVCIRAEESGSLYVSLTAIANMVCRYSKNLEGIRSVQTHVFEEEEGIRLKLKVTIAEGANIPSITEGLQGGLRSYITEITGMKVGNIDVLVASKQSPLSVN